jgi:hypothetical protein
MSSILRLAVLVPLLTACASNKEIYTADGQQGQVVSCTPGWTGGIVGAIADASTSWGQCYERAGEICGARGYVILQQVGEGGERADVSRYGGSARTTNNRMMVIKCK